MAFPDLTLNTLSTENEFVIAFHGDVLSNSCAVILDCHFPWGGLQEPPEGTSTPYRAGLRCAKRLLADSRFSWHSIAMWTLMGADVISDIREHVPCFEKTAEGVDALIEWLEAVLQRCD